MSSQFVFVLNTGTENQNQASFSRAHAVGTDVATIPVSWCYVAVALLRAALLVFVAYMDETSSCVSFLSYSALMEDHLEFNENKQANSK